MPLNTWFPLAIYYADLDGAQEQNPRLRQRIDALQAVSGAQRTSTASSWTGDVHNVDRLHLDPAFDWLTAAVGDHALRYLGELGHDLTKTDVYIQRAWPIVAKRDQRVERHAHHTAHLSAVYYVAASGDAAGGQIRFFNDAKPSQIAPGIDSDMTNGYAEYHALNFGSALYPPVAGRLILFPAKVTHAVDPNQTEDPRISVSFDLVITSRGGAQDGRHEFLMPPPTVWTRVDRTEPATPAVPPAGRTAFAAVATRHRAIDDFALPARDGHILWETAVLAHVSSPAAWAEYTALLDALPAEEWLRDHSGGIQLWRGCGSWRAWRDAIDRLHAHLRNVDVPLASATLGAPQLERRTAGSDTPFQRGKAHLSVYLRIDHGAGACTIECAEGGTHAIVPGALALVAGARRHRLTGDSHVIQFGLELPALARSGALAQRGLRRAEVLDATVFAAITAQPLSVPMPPPDALFEKIRWRDARDRRRARHDDCPSVRRFLIAHGEPGAATDHELALIRGHGIQADPPVAPGRMVALPDALSRDECATLRRFAEAHMTSVVPDTVDDLPEYQVNLTIDQLAALLGVDRRDALLALPAALGPHEQRDRVDIFLRVYSQATRRYIAFHADLCSVTANIALTDDAEVAGGRLLALDGDALRSLDRRAGTAIVHSGNLVHGVTRIDRGTRYALILFFHRRAEPAAVTQPTDVPVSAMA